MQTREMKTTDTDMAAFLLATGATFGIGEFELVGHRVAFLLRDVSDAQLGEFKSDTKNVNLNRFLKWKRILVDIAKHTTKYAEVN
jgi:hypothetical protein